MKKRFSLFVALLLSLVAVLVFWKDTNTPQIKPAPGAYSVGYDKSQTEKIFPNMSEVEIKDYMDQVMDYLQKTDPKDLDFSKFPEGLVITVRDGEKVYSNTSRQK